MPRARNPRTVAYLAIKNVRIYVTMMASTWGSPRKVVATVEGRRRWVRAPDDQQPENRVEDWRQLAADARSVIQWAEHILELARQNGAER